MPGLWRNQEDTLEGKYLVIRRDGTIPRWPWFVLGAKDPYASLALSYYARIAEDHGCDPEYVADIRALAREYDAYRQEHGKSDPTARPPKDQAVRDNADVLRLMKAVKPEGGSA